MARVIPLRQPAPGRPWYRQFWPWFIIAVPGISVVASFVSLFIAVRHADSLVPDHYRAGLALDRDLALEGVAAARRIVATLRVDAAHDELAVDVRGSGIDLASQLTLQLAHPTDATRDQLLQLRAGADGVFRAPLAAPLHGPWNATLAPAGGGWRLAARIDFDGPAPPQLGAGL